MARVKVLHRNAVFAWSPRNGINVQNFLATASSAQQMDASFSSNAQLEIYSLNDNPNILDLHPKHKMDISNRLNTLHWALAGPDNQGLIIGGGDNGLVVVYAASRIPEDPKPVSSTNSHSGHVLSLSTSTLQPHLLSSGGAASEIYMWDLNQPDQPMSIGPKEQPFEQVQCVDWNHKVPHILGSLTHSRALVWDLRKQDGPIMTLGDIGAQARWKCLSWHPDTATTMCLACEDDSFPVVQSWDVRYATTPLLQLEGHQKGITSMCWCEADSDLMLTAGKDQRLLLWNPNTSFILAEIPNAARNWPFLARWSRINPNLIGIGSFDGRVTVYSLDGSSGNTEAQSPNISTSPLATPKLQDAFPGTDFSHNPTPIDRRMSLLSQHSMPPVDYSQPIKLSHPPKWQRPGPCGASFAFGGKLVRFGRPENESALIMEQKYVPRCVDIVQIPVADDGVAQKLKDDMADLRRSLEDSTSLVDYCYRRAELAANDAHRQCWQALAVCAQGSNRSEYRTLLGQNDPQWNDLLNNLYTNLGSDKSQWQLGSAIAEDEDSTEESARVDSAETSILGDSATNSRLACELADVRQTMVLPIQPTSTDSQMCAAIAEGNINNAIELCIRNEKWADAILLAGSSDEQVYARTVKLYALAMAKENHTASRFMALIASGRWNDFVEAIEIAQWKYALRVILSFAPRDRLSTLCSQLSKRMLEQATLCDYACLPSITAVNINTFIEYVPSEIDGSELVSRALVLRHCAGSFSSQVASAPTKLIVALAGLARQLAYSGSVDDARALFNTIPLDKLKETNNQDALVLHEQLSIACGKHVDPMYEIKAVNSLKQPSIVNANALNNVSSTLYKQPAPSFARPRQQQQNFVYPSAEPTVPQPYAMTATQYANMAPQMNAQVRQPPIVPVAPQPQQTTTPSAQEYRSTESGWNDPPPMMMARKKEQPRSQTPAMQQPLTAPIANTQQQPVVPPIGAAVYSTQQHKTKVSPVQSAANDVAPAIPEQPIPDDYRPICDALDAFIGRLRQETLSNQQLQRRIEDSGVKTTTALYDCLRKRQLSQELVTKIQYCLQFAAHADYQNALGWHYNAVQSSGAEFTTISHFMPHLKQLLLLAHQFRI